MNYYCIEPEVPGGFGDRVIIDRSSGRLVVKKLHCLFDGWLGDELLESVPCYIISKRMSHEIERTALTGVRFDEVEITTSYEFTQLQKLHPDRKLPDFVWLQIVGKAGHDDFGIATGLRLIVSQRALDVLKAVGISHAVVTPFEG